jgi:putative toxin-antitoxin system antitoxin component (TIGR02293 family)
MHADHEARSTLVQSAPRGAGKSPVARLIAGRPQYAGLYTLGPLERIHAVRQGVPAQVLSTMAQGMHVTRDQLFQWAGIPRATANRKLRQSSLLSQDESERVLGIARLIGLVEQVVAESGSPDTFDAAVWTAAWLSNPLPALGGKKPGDFMDTADGRDLVAGLILQMQSGAYA